MMDYDENDDDPSSQLLNDLNHAAHQPVVNARDDLGGEPSPDAKLHSFLMGTGQEDENMSIMEEMHVDGDVSHDLLSNGEGPTDRADGVEGVTVALGDYIEHDPRCHSSPGASTPPDSQSGRDSSEARESGGDETEDNASDESDKEGATVGAELGLEEEEKEEGDDDDDDVRETSAAPPRHVAEPVFFPVDEFTKKQKADRTLHLKAKGLTPHKMAAERYWIAVLSHNITPKDARKEKDFLWIRGNRLTTVATVWHMYQNATAEGDFSLLTHDDRPEPEDVMEELDYYNDKLVVFRACAQKHYRDKGGEDAPIVIDDD